jgi:hypothetical protein
MYINKQKLTESTNGDNTINKFERVPGTKTNPVSTTAEIKKIYLADKKPT